MENTFKTAKWIWYTENFEKNTYGDFFDEFNYDGGKVLCNLSCDSDYTLFVNGEYVASNQYCDFAEYKIYDTIDVTKYLKNGKNEIYILVWYWGIETTRYYPENPGLLYEFICDNSIVAQSDEETLCRENPNYKNRYEKIVNSFLGFSYLYDATACSDTPCHKAVFAEKAVTLFPRPIKKQVVLDKIPFKVINKDDEGKHFLIDFEDEYLGLFTFKLKSPCKQKILILWGEKLLDGGLERFQCNNSRDYSVEYIAAEGINEYTNHMLRFSARYVEFFSEEPIEIEYCSLYPQVYETKKIDKEFENPLDQKIWNSCVHTLELCMMEHYVDNPWREQNLYGYDSSVQMRCGFNVFEGGNKDYVRANLLLFSKDKSNSNLLSLTTPSGSRLNGLSIPSYSLHYINTVKDYIKITGDSSLGVEVYDKLVSILSDFANNSKDNLVYDFPQYWNYYDWADYMDEQSFPQLKGKPHVVLNCLFVKALESLKEICSIISKEFVFEDVLEASRVAVKKAFYNQEKGLFTVTPGGDEYTELGNALPYLIGLTSDEESDKIIKALLSGELCETSLSFKCFKYDALIKYDAANKKSVIDEIRNTYKIMIDKGYNTVWETADEDYGSVCHGWSALPVLYLE